MGNRAIITTKEKKAGIYLQWNGGRDSIEPFIEYCKLKGYRSPENDSSYGLARLTQVIANYFGGTLSIGVVPSSDKWERIDNGTYIIGGNWEIVGRDYPYESFKEQNEYSLEEMLQEIDKAQPVKEQLGAVLTAKEKDVKELKKGDKVYFQNYDGAYEKFTVLGFGEDKFINGTNVLNKPYVDKYGEKDTFMNNLNNYILTDKIRICEDKPKNKQRDCR